MVVELAKGQREVLGFIAERIAAQGWPPTVREICEHFGWVSSNTAFCQLAALEKKGAIERLPNAARAIRVTAKGKAALQ